MLGQELQKLFLAVWLYWDGDSKLIVTQWLVLAYRDRNGQRFDVVHMLFQQLKQTVELNLLIWTKDSLEFLVKVDKPPFFRVLESIAFDVLPEGCNNLGSAFLLQAEDLL